MAGQFARQATICNAQATGHQDAKICLSCTLVYGLVAFNVGQRCMVFVQALRMTQPRAFGFVTVRRSISAASQPRSRRAFGGGERKRIEDLEVLVRPNKVGRTPATTPGA
jgi:hypothetical protein